MEVDRFFNGYGRLTLILMRKRHSFVFIQERRDAEDAVKELKGRKVRGENITLELLEKGSLRNFSEFPRYRLKVENISQNTASTELRDYMKQVSVQLLKSSSCDHDIEAGEVLECSAHPGGLRGEGFVEFARWRDLKWALEHFHDTKLCGRNLKLSEIVN